MSETTITSRDRWMVLLAAFLGWMFDGLEMGLFPLVARPALSDLMGMPGEELVGQWMGRITALFLVGAACGGLVFGWLGDRIGRVRAMTISILTYSVFTGLCYFAARPEQLGALRFVAALGMGGEWSLGVALVMECWPERFRPLLAGLIGAAANFGYLFIAALALKFHVRPDSWRWVMLAGSAPALLTFFIRLFVPESERWKQAVRNSAARPVREVFSPALLRTTLLAIAFAAVALIGTWGSVQWIPIWVDQMTGGKLPEAKAWAQIYSAGGAIVGCMIGPLVGGWLGRRPAYFGLCLASLLACGCLFRCFNEYNNMLLLMICVVGGTTAAFYGWLPLYLPELFPTRVRATGQGLSFNSGRIVAAVGAIYAGELVEHYGGDYARTGAIVTLIYLLGMALIWLAPETKGKSLPE